MAEQEQQQPDSGSRQSPRVLQGVVRGSKPDKTVVVMVSSRMLQKAYKKYVRIRKTFLAHDERNEYQVGDIVRIVPTRPLSRRKRWRVIELVERPS
jgi:small subunit ribosomal protein S17